MENFNILWIDACLHQSTDELIPNVRNLCDIEIVCVSDCSNICLSRARASPAIIIFDFNFPDLTGLQNLQRIKRAYSSVPVLMLTNEHSENLAVWALRTRVWDYLVKPFPVEVLLERIRLLQSEGVNISSRERVNLMPMPPIPIESRFRNRKDSVHDLKMACAYVKNHLHEKISEEIVAQICGMNRYEFSRIFKRHHGVTFQNYIIDCRLKRAAIMLRDTSSTVTDIALSVGINDLSHFAQLFRRNMQCTPSEYRTLHSG